MTGPHDPIIPGAPSWNGTGYSKLLANSVIRCFNRNNLIHLGVSRSHSVMPGGSRVIARRNDLECRHQVSCLEIGWREVEPYQLESKTVLPLSAYCEYIQLSVRCTRVH